MSFKCKIGLHSWNGCKCRKCEKTKDDNHSWKKDDCSICTICGKVKEENHSWKNNNCSLCAKCGKVKLENHSWNGCKCTKCGKVKNENHSWDGCKCTKCGRRRDEEHSWTYRLNACKCSKCGKENHIWDGCKCIKCGLTKDKNHIWDGCKCTKCGLTRNELHNWKGFKCIKCGRAHYFLDKFLDDKSLPWGVDYDELAKMDQKDEAIPILMNHYRQRNYQNRNVRTRVITEAMKAIGTTESIDPLFEIFRSCYPSEFEDDGQLFSNKIGEDKESAYALMDLLGIEKLRALCTFEEFERILVLCYHNGFKRDIEIQDALIEMGTPKALAILIDQMYQTHYPLNSRINTRNLIIKIGEKVNVKLLRELEYNISDRTKQTIYRKEILEVLKETGNDKCIPALLSIMEKDSSITEEVLQTIKSISKRYPEVIVPDSYAQKPLILKLFPKTGNLYVDRCFQIDFYEFDDPRDWSEIPEAKKFIDAERSGINTNDLLLLLDNIRTKYPDFHFSYAWIIKIYSSMGLDDNASIILKEGLNLSKRKDTICRAMGMAKWKSGDLPEALKWWINCLVLQLNRGAYHDYELFLYLSIIADNFSLYSESSVLKHYANKTGSGIEVIPQTIEKLSSQVSKQGTTSMKEALKMLIKEYLNK
jgi:hypothetical protein